MSFYRHLSHVNIYTTLGLGGQTNWFGWSACIIHIVLECMIPRHILGFELTHWLKMENFILIGLNHTNIL